MSEKTTGKAKHDPNVYRRNRSSHPLEELAKYGDEWVAWSADGTRIVAHAKEGLDAAAQVDALGIDMEDVVFEWIPPGGEIDTLL